MGNTPEKPGQDGPHEQGARILIIDDEEIIHVSLKRILNRHGHEVDAVFGVPEGLKMIASGAYDLVITDLMMPDINGIQLLQKLRAEGQDVPVLMITGYPTIRTALEALRLGAVDYLAKPFTRHELLGPVNRALRRAGSDRKPSGGEKAAAAPEDEKPPKPELAPGDRFYLREHSWAVYGQDGTMRIGIESRFLDSVDTVASLEVPPKGALVEQGFVAFTMKTGTRELHTVFAPLSGEVVEVNAEALKDPSSIEPDTWIVVIRPSRLETEIPVLLKCRP